MREVITGLSSNNKPLKAKIAYTIEFYPEEGKYHYTGHRKCGVVYSPNETRKMGVTCPVCGKELTLGFGVGTQQVSKVYEQLINSFGSEFNVLLTTPEVEIQKVVDPKIVE